MRSRLRLCASSYLSQANINSSIGAFVKRQNRLRNVVFSLLFICVGYTLFIINTQGSERMKELFAMQSLSFIYTEQLTDKASFIENVTGTIESKVMANTTHERYGLVEVYEQDTLQKVDPPFKKILFWNAYWAVPDFRLGIGRDAFRKWGCPVWQCETSTNRTNVHEYDAVILHMRGSWNPNDLPQRRSPHQRYVFWNLESAEWREYLNTSTLANYFNWTLTYRWDSDMVMPYGYVRPTGTVPLHPSQDQMKQLLSSSQNVNYAAGKTKMAAWFVSNCVNVHSRRNEMVKILQKYISVDVYGACGTMTCPKEVGVDNSSEDCRNMAGKNYKFYMALENSLCQDYVTEKFFGLLHRPVIPVVFGLHDHYDQIAPPHSYINAAKFENMSKLADYLTLLDKNDTLYNEYFWWRPHFESRYKQKDVNIGMCHLCASLHNKDLPPKIYSNMTDWWETKSNCIASPPIS